MNQAKKIGDITISKFLAILLSKKNEPLEENINDHIENKRTDALRLEKILNADRVNIQNLAKIALEGLKQFQSYGIFEKAFFELGWIIPPYLSENINGNNFVNVKLSQVNSRDKMDKYITGIFLNDNCSHFFKMVDLWSENKYFVDRISTFKDIIELIRENERRKKYNHLHDIIIPTLILHIDSIISEYTRIPHNYAGKKKKISNLVRQKFKRSFFIDFIIKNIVFGNAYPGQKFKIDINEELITSDLRETLDKRFINLNRHKIMHGENIKFGSLPIVLLYFFILDSLHELTFLIKD